MALLGLAVLAGCAVTPPTGVATGPSSSAPVTSAAVPTVSATPTVSPTVSATPTAAEGIVLAGDRIGTKTLGTAEAAVEGYLTSILGKPDDSYSGKVCELNSDTPYGRQVGYGSVFVQFQSAPGKGSSAPRKLSGWVMTLGDAPPAPLRLPDGYPATPSYAELKTTFPKGKLTTIALGETSFWIFTTPSGLWYRGDDSEAPMQAGAGPQEACD